MNQYLPYGGFKWMNKSEIEKFKLNSVDTASDEQSERAERVQRASDEGYILEVDVEYPDELHHLHNDCTMAPHKIKVTDNMLSWYCSNIAKKYDVKLSDVKNVIPNFGAREKYIVHYKNLQLYTSLGMKLLKVQNLNNLAG